MVSLTTLTLLRLPSPLLTNWSQLLMVATDIGRNLVRVASRSIVCLSIVSVTMAGHWADLLLSWL